MSERKQRLQDNGKSRLRKHPQGWTDVDEELELKMITENAMERVYRHVKAQIISRELFPGDRLQVEQIADDLFVSKTPVRDAFVKLMGEGLVEKIPTFGFFVKLLSESEIRDLYELNQMLLGATLGPLRKDHLVTNMVQSSPILLDRNRQISQEDKAFPSALVQICGELFCQIAGRSGNKSIVSRIRNINDMLNHVRLCECELIEGPQEELIQLCQLYYQKKFQNLSDMLKAYHTRRIIMLPNLMNVVQREP